MPLISARSPAPRPVAPLPCASPIEDLASDNPDLRRRAALALTGHPETVSLLADRLAEETVPAVRQALASTLVAIGDANAVRRLADFLASPHAALRCIALDSLKQLGDRAVGAVDTLLASPDPDVRLQAIEAVRAWPGADACARLRPLLERERHVNVCAAAVDVTAEVGSPDILPILADLPSRFPNDAFLGFAVSIAISRINAVDEHVR